MKAMSPAEAIPAMNDIWKDLGAGDTLWRLDVGFAVPSKRPSFLAWEEGDRQQAAELLGKETGLIEASEKDVYQSLVDFLDSSERFARDGGTHTRVILGEEAELHRPDSALGWRLEMVWPCVFLRRNGVRLERTYFLPLDKLDEVEPPDHDINWFGENISMRTLYGPDGDIIKRVFFDVTEPGDLEAMRADRKVRMGIEALVAAGVAVELAPKKLDEYL